MKDVVLEEFADLVAVDDPDLQIDRAALLIARAVQPDLDPEPYLYRLDLIAEHISISVSPSSPASDLLSALNFHLFEIEGLRGNRESYYDPRNSFLNEVLDRKIGIPVSLSMVYMEVARRIGLKVEGVGLPGHFIVKLVTLDGDHLVDPFNQGEVLTESSCMALLDRLYGSHTPFDRTYLKSLSRKRVLARLLNNLKAIYGHARDYMNAVRMVELSLRLHPGNVEDLRARGLLYFHLECYSQAWTDLEEYLVRCPDAVDFQDIQRQITTAREFASRYH